MGMLIRFIFLSIISLFGCQMKEEVPQTEDYEVYVNQIISSFSAEMKKEFGLICWGSGGKMPHDVEEVEVAFICYKHANIEEARELEVKVTEKFIQAINSHEKIRPFLREYPFRADRAQVSIAFENRKTKLSYFDGSVASVFQVKNKIFYRADKEGSYVLIPLMDEPYEEALKIVNESSK